MRPGFSDVPFLPYSRGPVIAFRAVSHKTVRSSFAGVLGTIVAEELRIALGWDGASLTAPDGCVWRSGHPVETAPACVTLETVRGEIGRVARGRKRAAILLGDVTLPAPYPRVLPELTDLLTACDIRPSRIVFLCCPGRAAPTLGLGAIRRYGEQTVGSFELRDWDADEGKLDPAYEAADLRLAVLPAVPHSRCAVPSLVPELCLCIDLGRGPRIECAGVRPVDPAHFPSDTARTVAVDDVAVDLLSGGGAPADATLEGALVSLRGWTLDAAATRSLVLAFDGRDGLGSARFTLDLWALLTQADEELAAAGRLPVVPAPGGREWDAVGALAAALCAFRQVVLFAPGLADHEEGDALVERLGEAPAIAHRLIWVARETDLWVALEKAHGSRYTLRTEPLGWRSRSVCST